MKNSYVLALLSGVLLAMSWPTYGVSLFIFIAFVPLLLVENSIRTSNVKRKKRKVLANAYVTFFVWNICTTWWIYYSTAIGMVFAVVVNSLLMALIFLLYHVVAARVSSKIYYIFLPAIWIAFEKFHLNWDFSWPWLNLGNVFATSTNLIQWYEYTGSFGGSLWVWVVNIIFFKGLLLYLDKRALKAIQKPLIKGLLFIAVPVIISLAIKLNYEEKNDPLSAVILQPNIDPYAEKYDMTNTDISRLLIKLAAKNVDSTTDIIIAPETVFAENTPLKRYERIMAFYQFRKFLRAYPKAHFLGGISLYEIVKDESKITYQSNKLKDGVWYNDFNSAFLLGTDTDSIPLYHKSKLVVGVENFPYKWLFEPIFGDMMLDLGGTVAMKTTQEDRTPFTTDTYSVAPVICYESVYGEFVSKYVYNGAEFLAIITNDAWWSDTQGHKQHLAYACLRAIETRRSVIRSANTGISAIINQTGEIEKTLPYLAQGAIKGSVNLNKQLTFYVKYGDYIARIAVFFSVVIFLSAFVRRRNT
ncbi:apolipoprotein N-acyltransferase [Neptunitalea chrysea]|uniref:Apolipoprotein N-acyltransferase n=1 Tax=Neptunitalea chrysea TaxID=1647581 RepID=A0A9W6B6A7_9FLAO|nr:apolipoprotein N-acyltransferase [Neptunitalea chrysea]GLB52064.1 apolipoprotein N-acyltransferase [Neptunitalea chrysea]